MREAVMYGTAKEGDLCPMCDTRLRSMRCASCRGTGRWFLFKCSVCGGTGKMRGCPNFFAHPGVGPQGSFAPEQIAKFVRAEA
jgi:hypothetical protein